jgi:ring-1,2-phenylacetyl-CoA epoxidase subunit PaaC
MATPLVERPSALPADALPGLVDLVTALADNKHALGLRYAEWCTCGPTIEAGVSATAIAQDELGHARVLYGLLEDLPGAPRRSEHEWTAEDARTVRALDRPFPTWPHLIVANALFDQALLAVLEAAAGSRYVPLRQRARKIIEEEQYHGIHGRGWLRQLGAGGPHVRAAVAAAVREWWAETLCWFGPGAGGVLEPLVRHGVLRDAGDAARRRYLAGAGPVLLEAGVPAPVTHDAGGWREAEPLPWARWDEGRRRMRDA